MSSAASASSEGYVKRWISLSQAAERLIQGWPGNDRKAVMRELWLALSDGAVAAQGIMRAGERTKGQPLNRFLFRPEYDDEDIAELIRSSEVIAWDLEPPVGWSVEVRWDDVAELFGLRAAVVATSTPAQPEPRLRIQQQAKKVRLDGIEVKLSPRSFRMLRILGNAAAAGMAPVMKRKLEEELLAGDFRATAIADGVYRLRTELEASGVSRQVANSLIENLRAEGYRLNLTESEIEIA